VTTWQVLVVVLKRAAQSVKLEGIRQLAVFFPLTTFIQGSSQDFSKGGAEVMEAKAL